MKKSLYLYTAAGCAWSASGLHLYLSLRSFRLKSGLAGESAVCSLSERWNCDAALLSSYGEIFGIPLSLFGLSANISAAFLLMRFRLDYKSPVYFMGGIALASLVMTAVSLWESLFCPLCYLTYALSYIGLFAVFRAALSSRVFSKEARPATDGSVATRESGGAKALLQELLKIPKGRGRAAGLWTAKAGAAVAGLAFLFYIALAGAFNLKDGDDIVKAALIDYRSEPALSFKAPSPFASRSPASSGEAPFMHITEFADFLCPHCKKTHPLMEKFLRNRPGVSFTFYVYPLDAQCNKQVSFSNGGLSCRIAKLSFCLKKLTSRPQESAPPSVSSAANAGRHSKGPNLGDASRSGPNLGAPPPPGKASVQSVSARKSAASGRAEAPDRRKSLNILKLVFQKQNLFLRALSSGGPEKGGFPGNGFGKTATSRDSSGEASADAVAQNKDRAGPHRGGPNLGGPNLGGPNLGGPNLGGPHRGGSGATKGASEAESRLIKEAGLSEEETLRCLNDSQTKKLLQRQTAEGFRADLSGVPAFFVNGKRLHVSGAGLFQSLHALYKELQP